MPSPGLAVQSSLWYFWLHTLTFHGVLLSPILPLHLMLKEYPAESNDFPEVKDDFRQYTGHSSVRWDNAGYELYGDSYDKRVKNKFSLRPRPSDELPVDPPQLPTEDRYPYPGEKDLNTRRLKKILGKHYDSEYMAHTRPWDSMVKPNGTLVYDFKRGEPRGEMPADIKQLSFNLSGPRKRLKLSTRKSRKKVQKFLWSYSSCAVLYTWKDLGQRFWPRWIREGTCYNERSCSIPAGMTCRTKESVSKTILWWYCRTANKCKWIQIKYPIITKCACKC